MNMNAQLSADMADMRASIRAAYLRARDAKDHAEIGRLTTLAVEVDSLRAKLALGALDNVARRVKAIRLGDLAGDDQASGDIGAPVMAPEPAAKPDLPEAPDADRPNSPIAWGAVTARKHGGAFNLRVREIAQGLGCDPSHLMAVMAFETGESFDPAISNAAGSGATGLIQFMPRTARRLGTTTTKLSRMTALRQLDFVEAYFTQATQRAIRTLSDLYMAVLWPVAVGKAESYVLFRTPSTAYRQNKGLDSNNDGVITKAEASAKVAAKLAKGMKMGRLG